MTLIDFVMPSLGADMEAGTVTEWLIKVGDSVSRGDIMAIVETDKADIDIEVWDEGTVTEILIPTGREVPVGTPLARLRVQGQDSEPPPTVPTAASQAVESPGHETVLEPSITAKSARVPTSDTGIAASPMARRLAHERGIDLAAIRGTGPEGAVLAADLEAGSTAQDAAPQREQERGPAATDRQRSEISPMRRAIADLLTRSKQEIPHYYLATDVDLEAMLSHLAEANNERPVRERLLPAAALIKAIAVAAAQHEPVNGFWVDDQFSPADRVHVGVAVSLRGGGLVAPAIHDADRLPIDELMSLLRDLVGRARSGRLRSSEMTDPTVTVSNLGDRGVDLVHGVIYPPQVALIGLGRITERPAVVEGVVMARRQLTISLSADHRASDGQIGARFLNTIDRLLQKPEDLAS